MKRRRPAAASVAESKAAAVRTGEHCPQTGWWYPLQPEPAASAATPAATAPAPAPEPSPVPRFVGQGSVMPAVAGVPSLWLPSLTG